MTFAIAMQPDMYVQAGTNAPWPSDEITFTSPILRAKSLSLVVQLLLLLLLTHCMVVPSQGCWAGAEA